MTAGYAPTGAVDLLRQELLTLDLELDGLRTSIADREARRDRVSRALEVLTDDEPTVTPTPAPTERPPAGATQPPQARKAPFIQRTRPGGVPPVDYGEVAKVYRDAVAAGRPPIAALMERFKVPETTAKNWPAVCRKRGLLDPVKPFTAEPITRTPFDPQKVRDEQAGPPVGMVRELTTRPEPPAVLTRDPAPAAPAWTPERAREHLEAVSR